MTVGGSDGSAAAGACLSGSRAKRTTLLCLLYVCQGVPWGFATIALLATLSEAGHSRVDTGTIVALAILPWTFKFLWAPLIDSVRFPAYGIRRPWIAVAQLCMALTMFGAWSTGAFESAATLTYLAWVFFVHNCFAALQDVATDALAVDLLQDDERGRVNGYMWAAKLIGIAIGGAGMATVIAVADLQTAILVQVLGLLAVLGLVLAWLERPGERRFPWSPAVTAGAARRGALGLALTARELFKALSLPTTALLVLVAFSMVITQGLFEPLTVEFFVQQLGWSARDYAQTQGTLGVAGEFAGALFGGWCCDRFGQVRTASIGMVLVSAVLLTFAASSANWVDPGFPAYLLLPAFLGTMAFTTVCLFSLFMRVSWTQAAATQFTLYMAVSNLGHAVGAKLSAWFAAVGIDLSIADAYTLAGLLPLIPLLLLIAVRPDTVEAHKAAHEAAHKARHAVAG